MRSACLIYNVHSGLQIMKLHAVYKKKLVVKAILFWRRRAVEEEENI